MIEQAEVQARVHATAVPGGRALSNEVRASLEAVRVAQEAARVRARSQTMRTRLWFAMLVAAVAWTSVAVGPRVVRWRHARAHAAAPAPVALPAQASAPAQPAAPVKATAPTPPEPVAPAARAPVAAATSADTPAPGASRTPPPPVTAEGKSNGGGVPAEGCDAGLVRKTPWLLSPAACALAFEADPNNAALALGIAHAEHVRGHVAETAQWAKRAVALDPTIAEAYILIARTDADDGRADDARAAYQRYLELAPRGWHQAEARTGVRRALTAAPVGSTRDR